MEIIENITVLVALPDSIYAVRRIIFQAHRLLVVYSNFSAHLFFRIFTDLMRYFVVITLFLSGCAVNTGVVELSSDTYIVSRQAATGFTGRGNLKEESISEANIFCRKQNKSLKVLSVQEAQPPYILGNFPKAEVQFTCLEGSAKSERTARNSDGVIQSDRSQQEKYQLNADKLVISSKENDAVAIIIGIQNYKRLGKADFANQDAEKFAEYAHRSLGIPKSRIKTLTDADADQAEILKTFRNWLPLQVTKDKTDVFVFYSGHGLPSADGRSLYLLPYGVDHDLLDDTAIDQRKIVAALQAAKPRSVTMFMDSCFSGLSKTGDTLLAGAKPVALKSTDIGYPSEFTVMTASSPDQISSASMDLQHGIFSFYLMKGMEGGADLDRDGKITVGEMHKFLTDNVPRQAMSMNRKQEPQFVGDANRVLVGR